MARAWIVLLALLGSVGADTPGAATPKTSPLDTLEPAKIPEEYRLAEQPREVVGVVRAHHRGIAAVAIADDGRTVTSTGWDNVLHIYRIEGGVLKDSAALASNPGGLALAPAGKLLYGGGTDAYVHVWDVSGLQVQERPKLSGHKNRPFALAMSPDGKMLASGSADPVLRVWKMAGDEPEAWGILANESAPSLGISSLAFSGDGKYLAAGHHAGMRTLRIWDVAGNYMDELEFPKTQARLVAFSPADPLLAFSADDSIRLWDLKAGKVRARKRLDGHPQKGPPGAVKALAFSPDGKWLASTGLDRRLILWDVATGRRDREWLFTLGLRALVFARDGRHLIVGNEEGAVIVVRLSSR